jgi:hypothetical protein
LELCRATVFPDLLSTAFRELLLRVLQAKAQGQLAQSPECAHSQVWGWSVPLFLQLRPRRPNQPLSCRLRLHPLLPHFLRRPLHRHQLRRPSSYSRAGELL